MSSATPNRTRPGPPDLEDVAAGGPESVPAPDSAASGPAVSARPAAPTTSGGRSADGPAPAPPWASYVALGDSMTEGLWDLDPADPSRTRGWADLLAATLSRRRVQNGLAPLQYANLAVRGRLLGQIVDEQLPAALATRPDLVSLIGAGNDILRPGANVDALVDRLQDAVIELRSAGVDVLLGTGMDPVASPVIKATRGRVAVYNSYVWSLARRHGAYVLDLWGSRSLRDWRMWSEDRIHLTTEGHARAAQAALVALGQPPEDEAWDDPLTALPPEAFGQRLRGNVQWLREHAYPWARRRLRRRSSGDRRTPKQAELAPLPPITPAPQPPTEEQP